MAKVHGPLHSDDARGKLANSVVFMGWKGIQDVRTWLKPTNPKATAQGNIRCILGGIGKAVGKMNKGSTYHTKLKDNNLIPNQQTKQSFMVQYIKNNYIAGSGATMTGNYNSIVSTFTGHTSYTAFNSKASGIGLADFSLAYDTVDAFEKGLGLYLLGKAGIDLGFTGSPYDTSLSTWTSTQIDALISDLGQ